MTRQHGALQSMSYGDYDTMNRSNHLRYDAAAYSQRTQGYPTNTGPRMPSYPAHRSAQYHGRTGNEQSQASRTDTPQTSRRRIPVACGRCRKRKIRCSGDPGDQSGCTNCKNANMKPGDCVFLRVGSECVSSASLDCSIGSQYGDHSSHNGILSVPPSNNYYNGPMNASAPMQRMAQVVPSQGMLSMGPSYISQNISKSVQNIYHTDPDNGHGASSIMYRPTYSHRVSDNLSSEIPVTGSTTESTPQYLLPDGQAAASMASNVLPSQPTMDSMHRSSSQLRSNNYYDRIAVDPATTMSQTSMSHLASSYAPRTPINSDLTYGFPALTSLQSSSLTTSGAERSTERALMLPAIQRGTTTSAASTGMQGGYGHLLNENSSNYWTSDNSTNMYMHSGTTPKIETVSSSMSTPSQPAYLSPVTTQASQTSHQISSYPATSQHYETSPTETTYGNDGIHGSAGSSPVSTPHSSHSSHSSSHFIGLNADGETDQKPHVKPESRQSPAHSYPSRANSDAGAPTSLNIPSGSTF